jgi:hypothetical protein
MQTVTGSTRSNLALLLSCSYAVLVLWYASRKRPSFDTAILIIPSFSYYLMLHELAILLIPITLRIRRRGNVLQFVTPYASRTATLPKFQEQLGKRVQAIALISHASLDPTGNIAIGPCFASTGNSRNNENLHSLPVLTKTRSRLALAHH